jgi:hypothetical protein
VSWPVMNSFACPSNTVPPALNIIHCFWSISSHPVSFSSNIRGRDTIFPIFFFFKKVVRCHARTSVRGPVEDEQVL